jgi:hypothetical protein
LSNKRKGKLKCRRPWKRANKKWRKKREKSNKRMKSLRKISKHSNQMKINPHMNSSICKKMMTMKSSSRKKQTFQSRLGSQP